MIVFTEALYVRQTIEKTKRMFNSKERNNMEAKINIAEILKDKPIDFVYLTKAMNIF